MLFLADNSYPYIKLAQVRPLSVLYVWSNLIFKTTLIVPLFKLGNGSTEIVSKLSEIMHSITSTINIQTQDCLIPVFLFSELQRRDVEIRSGGKKLSVNNK